MTGISLPWRAWMMANSGQRAGSVFWPMAIWVCWRRRIWLSFPAGEGWTNPYPKRSAGRSARRMPAAASYSICSGVFVLAASGLLDGRKATTHWRYTQALKTRYPAITVVEDVLYRDEGDILTSAGSAAGIDLCLHVVRRNYGMEVANRVARRLVIPPHRDGSQTQQLSRPVAQLRESQRLGQLFDYLHQHLAVSHTVESLALRVGMSQRTFLRRFGTRPEQRPRAGY